MPRGIPNTPELTYYSKGEAANIILGTARCIAEEHRRDQVFLTVDRNGTALNVNLDAIIGATMQSLRGEINTSLFTRKEVEELLIGNRVGVYSSVETEYPVTLAQESTV